MNIRKTVALAGVTAVIGLANLFPSGSAIAAGADHCPADSSVIHITAPGAGRIIDISNCRGQAKLVVEVAGSTMVVPEPGMGVTLTDVGSKESHSLTVMRAEDGRTIEVSQEDRATPMPTLNALTSPSACSDSINNDLNLVYWGEGNDVTGPQPWRYYVNTAGGTANLTPTAAIAAINQGTDAMASGYNDCGLAQSRIGRQPLREYLGTSTLEADVTATGCGSWDFANIVAFDVRPTNTLATTCYWWQSPVGGGRGHIVGADMEFATGYSWFSGPTPVGCANRFHVQSVASHEMGHVLGLGHVDDTTHEYLTMSTAIGPCDVSAQTLGRGDFLLLDLLY